jgi:hypothetical protein
LLAALAIILWSGLLILPVFGLLKAAGKFRVPSDIEQKGIDIWKHGEEAYPLDAYGHGWDEMQIIGIKMEGIKEEAEEEEAEQQQWHPVATIWHDPSKYAAEGIGQEEGNGGSSSRRVSQELESFGKYYINSQFAEAPSKWQPATAEWPLLIGEAI